MTNSLMLMRDGVPIEERPLADDALEVGRAASCDLVVDEADLPERAYLVQARGGTVWLFDLLRARSEARVLPIDRPLALGARHHLVRKYTGKLTRPRELGLVQGGRSDKLVTQAIDPDESVADCRWSVLVGRGHEARRIAVGERPLRVGKAAHNDLVLSDPTVSAEHCRFELAGGALVVRDLDSTNGTYVQGVRVSRARVSAGAQVRVGRTDLQVVARAGDAAVAAPEPRGMVAASISMQQLVGDARRFAQLPWPLLLLGPSGVGKEELAGLVHRDGTRKKGPLVALNAGGLPRELVESELFGHERGAFTGAHALRRGVFEQAHGGTLFLDEIGELPLSLQSRLLRVLETWQIRRVGGESDVAVDVRLVCATHRDLAAMVLAGTFRQDLYYRLARLVLHVAPLRERPEDILPLATHFLRALERELGGRSLTRAAEARLLLHDWPGNARELRNVLCAAAALSATPRLDADDVERAIVRVSGPLAPIVLDASAVERAVARYGGNLSAASRALDIPRSTLRDRMKKPSKTRDPTSGEP